MFQVCINNYPTLQKFDATGQEVTVLFVINKQKKR